MLKINVKYLSEKIEEDLSMLRDFISDQQQSWYYVGRLSFLSEMLLQLVKEEEEDA